MNYNRKRYYQSSNVEGNSRLVHEVLELREQVKALTASRNRWRELAESFSICPDGCEDCKNEYEETVNGQV